MEEKILEKKPKKHLKTISILVLFGLFIFLSFQIRGLKQEIPALKRTIFDLSFAEEAVRLVKLDINELKEEVTDLRIKMFFGKPALISLTSESYQKINESFTVFIDEVEPHLTGIKIKGGIINTSGVAHENIKFDVTVAEQTKELNILKRINSGYSRNFELFIPNVPVEKSEYATIKFVNSVMAWYQH